MRTPITAIRHKMVEWLYLSDCWQSSWAKLDLKICSFSAEVFRLSAYRGESLLKLRSDLSKRNNGEKCINDVSRGVCVCEGETGREIDVFTRNEFCWLCCVSGETSWVLIWSAVGSRQSCVVSRQSDFRFLDYRNSIFILRTTPSSAPAPATHLRLELHELLHSFKLILCPTKYFLWHRKL